MPYGDLSYNRHGTCWRVAHVRALNAVSGEDRAAVARALPPTGSPELARRVEAMRRNAWVPEPPPPPYVECAAGERLGRF